MELKLATDSMNHSKTLSLLNAYLKFWQGFVIQDKCSVSCTILQISQLDLFFPLA